VRDVLERELEAVGLHEVRVTESETQWEAEGISAYVLEELTTLSNEQRFPH
jgi:hypothetical protein